MKPTIITISGLPGSGSSTISRSVADTLGYSRFSSGDFMRSLAREQGMTLGEITSKAEEDPGIDRKIDRKIKNLADSDQLVLDSRLAFNFIPEGFSVYLDVDLDTAAKRIYNDPHDKRKENRVHELSIKEIRQHIGDRVESERERFRVLYGVDHTNRSNYDLVVDTGETSSDEATQTIIDAYKDWLKQGDGEKTDYPPNLT